MNKNLLPKILKRNGGAGFCLDLQRESVSTEIHWHDCAEIIHVMKGETLLFSNEKWETLSEGDTVFLPPGHLHCCRCGSEAAERVVIGLAENFIPDSGKEHAAALAPFHSERIHSWLIFRGGDALSGLFSGFYCEESGASAAAGLDTAIRIQRIYCEMLRMWESLGMIGAGYRRHPIVSKIEGIIRERFSEALTAGEVAARLNISYSYMAALLRKELHVSFGGLLLKERIAAAKKLLLATDMSITEIALETGFTDSSYFIKKFRAAAGMTPHKYRRINRVVPK